LRLIKAFVHFLASPEVRHVLLIDSDRGASVRIATVPRRAVSHTERTEPAQFHAVAARQRSNDFFENGVDDLFSVAPIKVWVLYRSARRKFGLDHGLTPMRIGLRDFRNDTDLSLGAGQRTIPHKR
jgi:hypothetical protein